MPMLSPDERHYLEKFYLNPANQKALEHVIKLTDVDREHFNTQNQHVTSYNCGRASVGRDLKIYLQNGLTINDNRRKTLWTRFRMRLAQWIQPRPRPRH